MSKKSLQKQADRADNIADQTVDEEVKENLRDAAKEYRVKAASGGKGKRNQEQRAAEADAKGPFETLKHLT